MLRLRRTECENRISEITIGISKFDPAVQARRGPRVAVANLTFCRTFGQICSPSTLRSSDEPSVGIGLRSRTVLARLRATAEPVSEKLLALELQVLKRTRSRAHSGDSRAG